MKKFLALIATASALAAAAPAFADTWTPINQRQASLDQRIDVGVRNGQLTRNEAVRLRSDFTEIANLEAQYRRGGLSVSERNDLDRRFDALSQRIGYERHDNDTRGPGGAWMPINQRQANLDARIDAGVRNGSLTRAEATRLRGEFNDLARLEVTYRRFGFTENERRDLDRRFDALSAQIHVDRHDAQNQWMPINQRQANLDARIDAGVRNGSLNRREAQNLRAEFNQIAALERRYRAGGLSVSERRDLDRRFDILSNNIQAERHDRDDRRGRS